MAPRITNWQAYQIHLRSPRMRHFEGRWMAYHKGNLLASRETEKELRSLLDRLAEGGCDIRNEVMIQKYELSDIAY